MNVFNQRVAKAYNDAAAFCTAASAAAGTASVCAVPTDYAPAGSGGICTHETPSIFGCANYVMFLKHLVANCGCSLNDTGHYS